MLADCIQVTEDVDMEMLEETFGYCFGNRPPEGSWVYREVGLSAVTICSDPEFRFRWEPVPLPEPAPADGWVRVAERLVTSVQEFVDGVGFCPCNAREDPCEHCHRLGMMLADAQDLKRLLPAPPVVEGGK